MSAKGEAIKEYIKLNLLPVGGSEVLFSLKGTPEDAPLKYVGEDGGEHVTPVASMILGIGEMEDDALREAIAYGRSTGFLKLRMVGADLLIVSKKCYAERWRDLKEMEARDGRIFGMELRKGGTLPADAYFMIIDNSVAAGTGTVVREEDIPRKRGSGGITETAAAAEPTKKLILDYLRQTISVLGTDYSPYAESGTGTRNYWEEF